MVEIKSGAPGTETLAKDYVDEYGRSWKRVVCERRADAADEWTVSLEQAYPCSTDPARMATTITLYDALSGSEGFRSVPFAANEGTVIVGGTATHAGLLPVVQLSGVAGTRSRHDRHGRLREQTMPDGRLTTHSFDLGRETSSGDGLVIDLLQRGVRTTVMRNGALLNSTRVNAFDERIEEGDALGNVTTHSFDIWGRRTASTFPETANWATCDATSVRERASERVTYSVNDEVLSIVNPLGKSVTKRYDPHGRVTEIIGPDGVTQETRIYDDAYEPITLPTGPLPPILDRGRTVEVSDNVRLRPRSVQTLDAMGNKYTIWLDALDRVYRRKRMAPRPSRRTMSVAESRAASLPRVRSSR